MKKIMMMMAAAMITLGGISAANAQEKPAPAPAKTEQQAKTHHTKTATHKGGKQAAKQHKAEAKKAQR